MNTLLNFRMLVVALVVFGAGLSVSVAQQKQPRPLDADGLAANSAEELAQRKAMLIEFVEEHHPDLKRLLGLLEERKPVQYRKAIRSLSRQFERLQTVKKRDPDKYEIALRYWKVQSRIEVLSARVALNGPEKYEKKLKELIRQKQKIKIEVQQYELTKLQQRTKKLQESLKKTKGSIDSEVERQFNSILNGSRRRGEINATNRIVPLRRTKRTAVQSTAASGLSELI